MISNSINELINRESSENPPYLLIKKGRVYKSPTKLLYKPQKKFRPEYTFGVSAEAPFEFQLPNTIVNFSKVEYDIFQDYGQRNPKLPPKVYSDKDRPSLLKQFQTYHIKEMTQENERKTNKDTPEELILDNSFIKKREKLPLIDDTKKETDSNHRLHNKYYETLKDPTAFHKKRGYFVDYTERNNIALVGFKHLRSSSLATENKSSPLKEPLPNSRPSLQKEPGSGLDVFYNYLNQKTFCIRDHSSPDRNKSLILDNSKASSNTSNYIAILDDHRNSSYNTLLDPKTARIVFNKEYARYAKSMPMRKDREFNNEDIPKTSKNLSLKNNIYGDDYPNEHARSTMYIETQKEYLKELIKHKKKYGNSETKYMPENKHLVTNEPGVKELLEEFSKIAHKEKKNRTNPRNHSSNYDHDKAELTTPIIKIRNKVQKIKLKNEIKTITTDSSNQQNQKNHFV